MAGRIAIIGGEPYAEWIERDDQAQRLFKAYRVALASNIIIINQTRKGKDNDHSN